MNTLPTTSVDFGATVSNSCNASLCKQERHIVTSVKSLQLKIRSYQRSMFFRVIGNNTTATGSVYM